MPKSFQLQFDQCGSFASCRSTQMYKVVQTSSSSITENTTDRQIESPKPWNHETMT